MRGTKCLIVTHGFFGDIIFASSIAKRLRHENQFNYVDYLIGFPQVARLVKNNPYINDVYVSEIPLPKPTHSKIDESKYDEIIRLNPLSFLEPPTIEFQKYAGVRNPVSSYRVYTDFQYDVFMKTEFRETSPIDFNKKTIAVMRNWKPKTYLFTKEEYERGIDVPNFGYGGKNRDVETIVERLKEKFNIIFVGVDADMNQYQTQNVDDTSPASILFQTSVMKYCDAFIGTEGGLCNLAAGVGTKTIITGDFVHQLYGPNGVIKKIDEPKLGPKYYFPNAGHVTLDPFLTDDEVYEQIVKELE
jgi:hypothetical protein